MSKETAKETSAEALFEKALDVAEKHLEMAMKEAGPLSPYVAVAMIEAAVNQAANVTGPEDIIDLLRDLADQIDSDVSEDDEDEGDDEEEEEDKK